MMKRIRRCEFVDEFKGMSADFDAAGLNALYDHLIAKEEEEGLELELDAIDLSIQYSQYGDLLEAAEACGFDLDLSDRKRDFVRGLPTDTLLNYSGYLGVDVDMDDFTPTPLYDVTDVAEELVDAVDDADDMRIAHIAAEAGFELDRDDCADDARRYLRRNAAELVEFNGGVIIKED